MSVAGGHRSSIILKPPGPLRDSDLPSYLLHIVPTGPRNQNKYSDRDDKLSMEAAAGLEVLIRGVTPVDSDNRTGR
jgi:hypothetical protein